MVVKSDSPTEPQEGAEPEAEAEGKGQDTGVQKRIDKLTAQKSKAEKQRAELQKELDAIKEQIQGLQGPSIDPQQFAELLTGITESVVESRMKELRGDVDQMALTQRFHLTPEQAQAVQSLKNKHNVDWEDAVVLATHKNPDLFQGGAFQQNVHGSLPPSGGSPRVGADSNKAKLAELQKKIDGASNVQERSRYVQQAFELVMAPHSPTRRNG